MRTWRRLKPEQPACAFLGQLAAPPPATAACLGHPLGLLGTIAAPARVAFQFPRMVLR